MKKVILCPNPYRDKGLAAAREAAEILREVGIRTVACLPFRMEGQDCGMETRPLQQELRGSDMIVAFGGDGTILHLAKTAATHSLPVLGVNLGSLGFMSELERNEMHLLRNLATGNFTRERRMMMDVSVEREGQKVYNNIGLNDAVVTKGAVARVIRMNVFVGNSRMGLVEGDGIVVATPTGSTAYSLSAGGPIVEPVARNFVVSPICAHSMHSNSYVLSAANTITVIPKDVGRKPVFLSVDGGRAFSLRAEDRVVIRTSRFETELIRLSDKSIFDILRTKMTGETHYEE